MRVKVDFPNYTMSAFVDERLKAIGKSPRWLAEEAGVAPGTLAKMLENGTGFSLETLAKVARSLQLYRWEVAARMTKEEIFEHMARAIFPKEILEGLPGDSKTIVDQLRELMLLSAESGRIGEELTKAQHRIRELEEKLVSTSMNALEISQQLNKTQAELLASRSNVASSSAIPEREDDWFSSWGSQNSQDSRPEESKNPLLSKDDPLPAETSPEEEEIQIYFKPDINPTDSNAFGKALSMARERMKASAQSFADRLGVSNSNIYRWERGAQIPQKSFVDEIAYVYGMEPQFVHRLYQSARVQHTTVDEPAPASATGRKQIKSSTAPAKDKRHEARNKVLSVLAPILSRYKEKSGFSLTMMDGNFGTANGTIGRMLSGMGIVGPDNLESIVRKLKIDDAEKAKLAEVVSDYVEASDWRSPFSGYDASRILAL